MRLASKQMPAPLLPTLAQQVIGWAVIVGIIAMPGLLWWPLPFVWMAAVVIGTWHGRRLDRALAAQRSGENICSFARSFPRTGLDTWIVRATYEKLADRFPIRADDTIEGDLRLTAEDLDDIAESIAMRAGRSLTSTEQNPSSAP